MFMIGSKLLLLFRYFTFLALLLDNLLGLSVSGLHNVNIARSHRTNLLTSEVVDGVDAVRESNGLRLVDAVYQTREGYCTSDKCF